MSFEVGQQVSDYEILGVLGAGGMGRVYRVRNKISERVEAMKVLLPDLTSEPELANRFVSEIRTLASFFHPNIAQLHTAFQFENQLVMIMEFVEGLTLAERARTSALPLRDVLSYITQVLAALSYAHERSVVHRDIKPENIMVTPHGIAKLMDFGIAKSNTERLKTQPGTTMGSLYYMSPEQIHGTTVDARSDIYSVGITLYELTAGRRPFTGANTYAILDQQLNAAPQPPIEVNSALSPDLNDIILTAIAKEPMHRFRSAEAFRNALEAVRAKLDAPAPVTQTQDAGPRMVRPPFANAAAPPPLPPPVPKSHRGLWMASGALAFVLILGAAAVFVPSFVRARADNKVLQSNSDQPPAQSASPSPVAQAPVAEASPSSPPTVVPQPESSSPSETNRPVARTYATSGGRPVSHGNPQISQPPDRPQPAGQQETGPQAQTPPVTPQTQPAGPSEEEVNSARDRMMQLSARANAVKSSVDRLRDQLAANGLGLRQDMAGSLSQMESYMDEADRALQSNNPALAQKRMDQAERQVETLEKFTGNR
jgi:serine/threonine-protein kinase